MFTWWVSEPYGKVEKQLQAFISTIREELVGVKPGDKDAITGELINCTGSSECDCFL